MNKAISVGQDTFWVGTNDLETHLFESLWSLPRGVAYNAYVILGEKTAAIDTVKATQFGEYLEKVRAALAGRQLDYLVVNHMEPDHSGVITQLREAYPDLKIIGNAKTLPLLKGYYGIDSGVVQVADDETLDIGGHVLSFHTIPMVHWPESMVTYDAATKTLFSNDAFGGYGIHEGGLFDDEKCRVRWESEMLRYYATIVARFSAPVQAALKKLQRLKIEKIYPSHGTLFRSDIAQVIELYDRWSSHKTESGAVVVFGSMYGHTRQMAEEVTKGLTEGGIKTVCLHDASRSNLSYILSDAWRYRGLVILSCTYNMMLFPTVAAFCEKFQNSTPKKRSLGIAGSYSWSSGALPALRKFADEIKLDKIGPEVEVLTAPTAHDLEQCHLLGENMAKAVADA
ncbi:flavodoxin [Synergistales bacterium]|nr:flavodoxin [Synergistales bacterium]